jgi:hypothetical protein
MPKVVPSQVVEALDTLFGPRRHDLDGQAVTPKYHAEVHALIGMLAAVPSELIDLPSSEYLEYMRASAVLSTALARWNVGDPRPAKDVGGKDVVSCLRRLMSRCRDELPPPEPELPFIENTDIRLGIEDRIRAAWTDFNAHEWMGATVLSGAALEALLLWALKSGRPSELVSPDLDRLRLAQLIDLAVSDSLITEATGTQARLAKDARNLIHPGRALRSGESCNKATALTSLAAVYRVSDDLMTMPPRP